VTLHASGCQGAGLGYNKSTLLQQQDGATLGLVDGRDMRCRLWRSDSSCWCWHGTCCWGLQGVVVWPQWWSGGSRCWCIAAASNAGGLVSSRTCVGLVSSERVGSEVLRHCIVMLTCRSMLQLPLHLVVSSCGCVEPCTSSVQQESQLQWLQWELLHTVSCSLSAR
jgi:hypothetical protein